MAFTKLLLIRKEKGLSCRDLAGLTGVHFTTVNNVERGVGSSPKVDTIQSIARALSVTMADILEPIDDEVAASVYALLSEEERVRRLRKRSIDWQKRNPQKVKASQLARYNNEDLIVINECSCDVPRNNKDRHHPDYTRPLEVMLLCRACHAELHAKLRKSGQASKYRSPKRATAITMHQATTEPTTTPGA